MDLTLAEHRRRRGNAKENLMKITATLTKLQLSPPEKLKAHQIQKQTELLGKADEAFQLHHQAISELDDDYDENLHGNESEEFDNSVSSLQDTLEDLSATVKAHGLMLNLQDAVGRLEHAAKDGYGLFLEPKYDQVRQLFEEFAKAVSPTCSGRGSLPKHSSQPP